tara:strand:+ start:24 stop:560 length:537 start_codon:yes stop_codon:yes gene_type:complete
MNDKHNTALAEPIIKKLLDTLGSKWKHGSCLNDSCASIYRDFGNDQFMSIYVPNATKTNSQQEEYSNFHVNISDNEYPQYDSIAEVIQSAKDMEEEQEMAKLLFAESEKIDPSECDTYDATFVEATKAEVHKCKATGWHYLYYSQEEEYQYYSCIGRDDGGFKTLEALQKWARPLYFQ